MKSIKYVSLLMILNTACSPVDESFFIHNDNSARIDQYDLPEALDKRFSHFELCGPHLSDNASILITRESSLKNRPQSLLDSLLFSHVPYYDEPVAHIEVQDNKISIQPKKGLVGFVTCNNPHIGVNATVQSSSQSLEKQLASAHALFETAVAQEYVFHFYHTGHCLKRGRPFYSPLAGSIVLKLTSHSERNSSEITFEHTMKKTDGKGSQTVRNHIVYPTREKCSAQLNEAYRQVNELKRCLRTPSIFVVQQKETL